MQRGTGVSRRFRQHHSSELLSARRELNPQDGEKSYVRDPHCNFEFVISCFLIRSSQLLAVKWD